MISYTIQIQMFKLLSAPHVVVAQWLRRGVEEEVVANKSKHDFPSIRTNSKPGAYAGGVTNMPFTYGSKLISFRGGNTPYPHFFRNPHLPKLILHTPLFKVIDILS